MKAVQYFSDDYLEQCRELSTTQIIQYQTQIKALMKAWLLDPDVPRLK